jgi:hypothetical protein
MNQKDKNNIIIVIFGIGLILLTVYFCCSLTSVENYDILDGSTLDNTFYPLNHELDYTCTDLSHEHASEKWRYPRYTDIISPHSDTPNVNNIFSNSPEEYRIAEEQNYPEEIFAEEDRIAEEEISAEEENSPVAEENANEGFNDIKPINFLDGKYESPFEKEIYEYCPELALKQEGAKELIDSYYFDPYPYIEYKKINNHKGRFKNLRY